MDGDKAKSESVAVSQRVRSKVEGRIAHVVPALFGLAVLQSWTAIMSSTAQQIAAVPFEYAHLAFDVGSMPTLLLLIAFWKKIGKVSRRGRLKGIALGVAFAGNAAIALAVVMQGSLGFELPLAGLAACGAAFPVLVLCWWESYGLLNSAEVAFYYAGSMALRVVLVALLSGYRLDWLICLVVVLPAMSLALASQVDRRLAQDGVELRGPSRTVSFPWKPLLLVGLYSFANGCGSWFVTGGGLAASRIGMLLVALAACFAVLCSAKWFNFSVAYRFILPVAVVSLVVVFVVPAPNVSLSAFLLEASITAVRIYTAILFCNLVRRYRASAALLFSLSNLADVLFLLLGTFLRMVLPQIVVTTLCLVSVLVVAFLLASEPVPASTWGVMLVPRSEGESRQMRIEIAVDSLSKSFALSVRESEILLMIAQGQQPRAIGNTLHIAPGTVKAHVQHIYKKCGVHSKEELLDMLSK